MSGIDPIHRAAAWNVYFLDESDLTFAGLYQAKGMVTYRDAFDELKLCFELDAHSALTLWRLMPTVAGASFTGIVEVRADSPLDILDFPVAVDESSPITRYIVMNHNIGSCRAPGGDLNAHITGN